MWKPLMRTAVAKPLGYVNFRSTQTTHMSSCLIPRVSLRPQPPPKEPASSSAGCMNTTRHAEHLRQDELSKQNADNQKKQKYHHKGGAKPFIQHAMKAHKSGALLSMIDNWRALHKDKKGQWINDVAQEKHDEMKKMQD
ncbi:hypothetical protein GBA52_025026 [Prunus armeniaca]|nr:hypothetical protein GBA52_025026 [Prunus armeniaca]